MRSLAAALAAAAVACSSPAPPEPAPLRDRPLASDGTAAREVTSVPDRVKVQLDLSAVRAALQAYRAEHGAWPATIGEANAGALHYPADLAYEPASGTVTSRTYPTF